MTIDSLKQEKNSFIRFYKGQGSTCESVPFLNTDDFVLIIMNSVQADLLKKYGENIICVDGMHGIGYDFTLFSIIIMDEYHTGFPCSIMIFDQLVLLHMGKFHRKLNY